MRLRQSRFLSIPEIEDVFSVALAADADPALAAVTEIPKPAELSWRDWTIFLLHTAAEIEHALMVQYLYAAYSLGAAPFEGPSVPANAEELVNDPDHGWRAMIVEIAKQEMGHLMTVENLLHLIGGPLNFEREDMPFRSLLYPFPLQLEPLSKTSLAKYISAEQPADPQRPPEVMEEIHRRATGATGGMAINRVGVLYHTLVKIFDDPTRLPDDEMDWRTKTTYQASQNDWLGSDTMLIREIGGRAEAVTALQLIGEQGEGPDGAAAGHLPEPSHFDRFFEIYEAFPETDPNVGPVPWKPARAVPTNPNTLADPDPDPEIEAGRITEPTSRLWAQLFNVRYRLLLLDLAHFLHLPDPLKDPATGAVTPRGRLRQWALLEMRGTGVRGLRGLAVQLTSLPRRPGGGSDVAGAPFELPYTLALPAQERDRWRLHLTLLDGSAWLVQQLEQAGGPNELLTELKLLDSRARPVIGGQIPQLPPQPPGPPG